MSSHSDSVDSHDISNLEAVRDLFAHADPVPADLIERMKFALSVQALHAEVAELMDSVPVPTRQGDGGVVPTPTDSVTFTATSVSLMVTPSDNDAGRVRLDGWVTQAGATVEVVTAEGSHRVISDANGRFVQQDVAHGSIHFVIMTDPDDNAVRPVITPTIEI